MLYKKTKDIKKRQLFFKAEQLKKVFKLLSIKFSLLYKKNNKKSKKLESIELQIQKSRIRLALMNLQHKITQISKTQIKNRCIISNRNKSVYRSHSISRLKMLEYLKFGILPGYKKAVW